MSDVSHWGNIKFVNIDQFCLVRQWLTWRNLRSDDSAVLHANDDSPAVDNVLEEKCVVDLSHVLRKDLGNISVWNFETCERVILELELTVPQNL